MVNLLIGLVVLFLATVPIHEFGHWIVAYRFGWKPKIRRWRWGLAVETKKMEINSVDEFPEIYRQLVTFRASGSIFSLIALGFAKMFNVYSDYMFAFLVILISFYGWWEVLSNPFKKLQDG